MDLSYNPSEQKRAPLKYPSADYSESFERQSTIDSDTENTSKSVIGSEPIRKSPREYIIPIAVEGANYITPRADSVDIESKNSASSLSSLSRSRFGKSRRISSLLSDASEDDESPFLSLSRQVSLFQFKRTIKNYFQNPDLGYYFFLYFPKIQFFRLIFKNSDFLHFSFKYCKKKIIS